VFTTIRFDYFKAKLEELAVLMNSRMDKGFPGIAFQRMSESTYYISDLDKALKQMEDGENQKITWPRLKWCLNMARAVRIEREQEALKERERQEAREFFHGDLPKKRCLPDERHCTTCYLKACPELWFQIMHRFRQMHQHRLTLEAYNRYVNEEIYDEFPTRINKADRTPLRSERMQQEYERVFSMDRRPRLGVVMDTEEGTIIREPEGWEA